MNDEEEVDKLLAATNVKPLGGAITAEGQTNGVKLAYVALQLAFKERERLGMPMALTRNDVDGFMIKMIEG